MATSDQNPYQAPQEASRLAPTANASIAKKPPWRIWKRLVLLGLGLLLPSLAVIWVIDSMEAEQQRHFTGALFDTVAMFFVTCGIIGEILVMVFGPILLIQSLLRFMRSKGISYWLSKSRSQYD
jgi:hypothetical protein